MINNYSVDNFKIHKNGYGFNLSGLTLLTGVNNSGKSSLTQSLRLLSKINSNSLSYSRLPFEQISELGDFTKTLNKSVNRSESIIYRFSLDIDGFKFCNIELEFDSIYNYEVAFIDMLEQAILKKIDIYFENEQGILKNYVFIVNLDGELPITYDLNEINLDADSKQNLMQSGIIVRGICPQFIPKELQDGYKELLITSAHLGNLNESSIKYIPALRNIEASNSAQIIENNKERVIFDGKTKLIDAFNIWTNKILNSEFRVKVEANKPKIVAIDNDIEFELSQIGFGNTQVIPIIVAILTAKKGDLVIIENPEVHLHPKWKTNLVELFYYAVSKGINILLETQSMEIINRVRVYIKNDNTLNSKTSLYFFKKKGLEANVQKIDIEKTGNLDVWPDDFLDKVTIEDSFKLL